MGHWIPLLCCALLLLASRLIEASNDQTILGRLYNNQTTLEPDEIEYWMNHDMNLDIKSDKQNHPVWAWKAKTQLLTGQYIEFLETISKTQSLQNLEDFEQQYLDSLLKLAKYLAGYNTEDYDEIIARGLNSGHLQLLFTVDPINVIEGYAPRRIENMGEREVEQLLKKSKEGEKHQKYQLLQRKSVLLAPLNPDMAFDAIIQSLETIKKDGQYNFDEKTKLSEQTVMRMATMTIDSKRASQSAELIVKIKDNVQVKDKNKLFEKVLKTATPKMLTKIVEVATKEVKSSKVDGTVETKTPDLVTPYRLFKTFEAANNISQAAEALIKHYQVLDKAPSETIVGDLVFMIKKIPILDLELDVKKPHPSQEYFKHLKPLWEKADEKAFEEAFSKASSRDLEGLVESLYSELAYFEPLIQATLKRVQGMLEKPDLDSIVPLNIWLKLNSLKAVQDPTLLQSWFVKALRIPEINVAELLEKVRISQDGNLEAELYFLAEAINEIVDENLAISYVAELLSKLKGFDKDEIKKTVIDILDPQKIARLFSNIHTKQIFKNLVETIESWEELSALEWAKTGSSKYIEAMILHLGQLTIKTSPEIVEILDDIVDYDQLSLKIFKECMTHTLISEEKRKNCLIPLLTSNKDNPEQWSQVISLLEQDPNSWELRTFLLLRGGLVSNRLEAMFQVMSRETLGQAADSLKMVGKDPAPIVLATLIKWLLKKAENDYDCSNPNSYYSILLRLGIDKVNNSEIKECFDKFWQLSAHAIDKCSDPAKKQFATHVITFLKNYPLTEDQMPISKTLAPQVIDQLVEDGQQQLAKWLIKAHQNLFDTTLYYQKLMTVTKSVEDFQEMIDIIQSFSKLDDIVSAVNKIIHWSTFVEALNRIPRPLTDKERLLYYETIRSLNTANPTDEQVIKGAICLDQSRLYDPKHSLYIFRIAQKVVGQMTEIQKDDLYNDLGSIECPGSDLSSQGLFYTAIAESFYANVPAAIDSTLRSIEHHQQCVKAGLNPIQLNNPNNLIYMLRKGEGYEGELWQAIKEGALPGYEWIIKSRKVNRPDSLLDLMSFESLVLLGSEPPLPTAQEIKDGKFLNVFIPFISEETTEAGQASMMLDKELISIHKVHDAMFWSLTTECRPTINSNSNQANTKKRDCPTDVYDIFWCKEATLSSLEGATLQQLTRYLLSDQCFMEISTSNEDLFYTFFSQNVGKFDHLVFEKETLLKMGPKMASHLSSRQLQNMYQKFSLVEANHPYQAFSEASGEAILKAIMQAGKSQDLYAEAFLLPKGTLWNLVFANQQSPLNDKQTERLLANLPREEFEEKMNELPKQTRVEPQLMRYFGVAVESYHNSCRAITPEFRHTRPIFGNVGPECKMYTDYKGMHDLFTTKKAPTEEEKVPQRIKTINWTRFLREKKLRNLHGRSKAPIYSTSLLSPSALHPPPPPLPVAIVPIRASASVRAPSTPEIIEKPTSMSSGLIITLTILSGSIIGLAAVLAIIVIHRVWVAKQKEELDANLNT